MTFAEQNMRVLLKDCLLDVKGHGHRIYNFETENGLHFAKIIIIIMNMITVIIIIMITVIIVVMIICRRGDWPKLAKDANTG